MDKRKKEKRKKKRNRKRKRVGKNHRKWIESNRTTRTTSVDRGLCLTEIKKEARVIDRSRDRGIETARDTQRGKDKITCATFRRGKGAVKRGKKRGKKRRKKEEKKSRARQCELGEVEVEVVVRHARMRCG